MVAHGAPLRTSVCHCLNCRARTGSAFAAQARFAADAITLAGEVREWRQTGDEGSVATHRFCPVCGVTCWYTVSAEPDVVAVQWGLFEDPGALPRPAYSVYETRKFAWVQVEADEHYA